MIEKTYRMLTPKLKRYVQRMWCKQSIVFDILWQIISRIPNYQELTFVDLFWWWWAVSANATHFFNKVIYNEIDKWVHDLFIAVQDTNFITKLKQRRVSREEFKRLNQEVIEDNLLLTARSFWNNRSDYLYWKQIERRKYLTHHIVFCKTEEEYKSLIKQYNEEKVATFNKYWWLWTCYLKDDDRDVFSKQKDRRCYKFWKKSNYYRVFEKQIDIELLKADRGDMQNPQDVKLIQDIERLQSLQSLESLERLQSLERLERLESLESLQSLQSLQRLELNNLDYRDVKLPAPDSCVIYLDPPYRNTSWYEIKFNFDDFDKYVLELKDKWYKIFISEYNLPYWEVIRSKTKRWMISQKKDNMTWKENLYFMW